MGADDYTDMEGVIGSNSAFTGADTLNGSAVAATNDVFWGMAGNDTLNGNLGMTRCAVVGAMTRSMVALHRLA